MFSKIYEPLAAVIVMALLAMSGCDQPTTVQQDNEKSLEEQAVEIEQQHGDPIEGQYIVVFKDGNKEMLGKAKQVSRQVNSMVSEYKIPSEHVINKYSASMTGFTVKIDELDKLEKLKKDSRVDYIEQDKIVMLSPPRASQSFWCIYFGIGCDTGGGDPQVTPYGIERVGGPFDGTGQTAWVIDTGVDLDHNDLNIDTQQSTSFVTGESADDGNGHGTHVSGTIAALDNDIDVVGVAAGATVVGVKVLSNSGSGTTSGVIEGIDYVAQNASAGDVANMSLGGGTSTALDDAVKNAASQGIYFALAAGNDGADANGSSPARVNGSNIYTISAIDSNDDFASFSNYGNPPVDYAAPGVDVESLWKNNGVNTISGTSMASPHAAGILLITNNNPSSDGTANGDPDGTADPIIFN